MIPMLGWFIIIVLLLLLAVLAIKFLVLRILLVALLATPILLSASYFALKQSPVTGTSKTSFLKNFSVATESVNINSSLNDETLATFRKAKTAGVDTIQMTVRMTTDGVLIIYKFSEIIGADNITYVISDTHYSQLPRNVPVLLFDDAVKWCANNSVKMFLEIPEYSADLLIYIRNKLMQDDLYSKVAVTTTNVMTALESRMKDSSLLIGFIWGSTENSIVNGVQQGNAYTSWMFSTMDSALYWGVRSLLLPTFIGTDFLITNVADADDSLINDLASSSIISVIRNVTTSQEKSFFQKQLTLPIMLTTLSP